MHPSNSSKQNLIIDHNACDTLFDPAPYCPGRSGVVADKHGKNKCPIFVSDKIAAECNIIVECTGLGKNSSRVFCVKPFQRACTACRKNITYTFPAKFVAHFVKHKNEILRRK